MASNIPPDDNLLFLFRCLKASDYKFIDFEAVGAATGLEESDARIRFSRLKKTLDAGNSASASSSDQAGSGIGTTTPNEVEQKTTTPKSDDLVEAAVSGDEYEKIDHNRTPVKIESDSLGTNLIVPPAPMKPRARAEKIGLSVPFESNVSPTPRARKRKARHISDDEDDQTLTQGNDPFIDRSGRNGGSTTKRPRGPSIKKELNHPKSSCALFLTQHDFSLQTSTEKHLTPFSPEPSAVARSQSASRFPFPQPPPRHPLNNRIIQEIMPSIETDNNFDWQAAMEESTRGPRPPGATLAIENDDKEAAAQTQRSMGPEPEEWECVVA